MSYSYPLNIPTAPAFNEFELIQMPIGSVVPSPYTGEQEVQVFPGQWWEANVSLPPMEKDNIAAWRAFFAKLNGVEGTFLFGDPNFATPRGSAASAPGTPLVDGNQSANATSLDIKGAPNNATGYLLEGDFIQLGSGTSTRLHMALTDVNTDGSGDATIDIWPYLRADVSDGATVVVSNCKGLWRLPEGRTSDRARPRPVFETSFRVIEAR